MKRWINNFTFPHPILVYIISEITAMDISYYFPPLYRWIIIGISLMGMIYAYIGFFVRVMRGDELKRKIFLDSMTITIVIVYILASITHSLSINLYGHLEAWMDQYILESMMFIQLISYYFVKKRYE